MSDMVERVREALTSFRLEHVSREEVIVMIRAMREPNEAILAAAKKHNDGVKNLDEDWDGCHRRMWAAMIGAVLNPSA